MQWIDDYALGIQEIDDQHKGFHEQFLAKLMDVERNSIDAPGEGDLCKQLSDWFKKKALCIIEQST